LWRAVDEHGAELDVLVQKRRDKAAAKRFFRRVLRSNPVPRKIVTDRLRSYPAAKADIPELAHVKHVFVKAAARGLTRPPKQRDTASAAEVVPSALSQNPLHYLHTRGPCRSSEKMSSLTHLIIQRLRLYMHALNPVHRIRLPNP
jgi:transposase-like protein